MQFTLEPVTQIGGALYEVFVLDDFDMGECGGAGCGMARKGVDMPESGPGASNGLGNLLGRNRGANGQITPRETLGDGHNVRRNAPVLTGEHPPGAAETRLDFVEDEQDAMPVAQIAHALQISIRGKGKARVGARDGVHDDGRDGLGTLPFQNGCQILEAGQRTGAGIQAELAAITIRGHGVGEPRQQGFVGFAAACQAGRGERAERGAVI